MEATYHSYSSHHQSMVGHLLFYSFIDISRNSLTVREILANSSD